MVRSRSVADFGPVMQLGYVVGDLESALEFWSGKMGVGPFFRISHVPFNGSLYYGQPSAVDITTAIAYWGELQIELIQQHNGVASTFKAWSDSGARGVHHICVRIHDLEAARLHCLEAGGTVVQEAWMDGAGHFIYVDLAGGAGSLVELAQLHPTFSELFSYMRRVSQGWNGVNPVREIPPASEWGRE